MRRGASSTSISPRRRQPTAASQVRGAATGDLPMIRATAVRHPVNHTADDRGSSVLFGSMIVGKKLYVGNLTYQVTSADLEQLFAESTDELRGKLTLAID